jgi:CubicO group peptidase (beta-lactamase class C family)
MNRTSNQYATAAELKLMEGFPPPVDKRVNRSNALLTPPYNRWSYQHMRMLYPSAGIPNADRPSPIKRSIDPGIAGLTVSKPDDSGNPSGESVAMDAYLMETYTDALVVVKGDQIVFEEYFNSMHPAQPHQMMSVTKSFTGLFGLMAVEDGHASESDPVIKHVPELRAAGAFKDATFGQVLDMTNSMDFTEVYDDPESGIRHYGVVLGLMEPVAGRTYAGSIYEYLPTLPKDPQYEHGEIFHYQTPKTDVVNWVTNRVTGASFQDSLYSKLWSKLGTDSEAYVLLDKNATLFAGGGLNASPLDLARFAMMMINDGRFNGQQVVAPSVIKKLSDGASRQAFSNGPDAKGIMANGDWSYRAQWWVRHTPDKEAFTAIGIHGQWIYIDLSRNVAIVKQSSQPTSAADYETAYDILGFDAIVDYLSAE